MGRTALHEIVSSSTRLQRDARRRGSSSSSSSAAADLALIRALINSGADANIKDEVLYVAGPGTLPPPSYCTDQYHRYQRRYLSRGYAGRSPDICPPQPTSAPAPEITITDMMS